MTDTTGLTAAQTATITVTQNNAAPVVATPLILSLSQADSPTSLDLLNGATDANGDVLIITGLTVTGNTGGITQSGTSLTIDPLLYQSLPAGASEVVTYSYSIEDGRGGTISQTATITINGLNDAPVAIADTNTIDEDGTLVVPATSGVLINDTDVDTGATRTITAVQGLTTNVGTAVTLASGSVLTLNADGSYEFAPGQELSLGQSATDSVTFSVTDDQGATVADSLLITVTGNNDLPSISPSFFGTLESQTLIGADSLLVNGFDPDPLDVIAFASASIDGVTVLANTPTLLNSGATVTIDSAGVVNYDPSNSRFFRGLDEGDFNTEDFVFIINDGQGGTATTNFSIGIGGESSPELLIFSHDDALFIEPGLDIVGDTTLNLQGARITVDPDEYQDFSLLTVADTGPNVVSAVTNFAALTANALQIDRDFFAFTENRFAVDDRIATVTIEGLLNEVNDNADAFVVNANSGETLIIDIDGASQQGLSDSPVEVTLFDSAGNLLVTQTIGNQFDIGSLDTLDPIFTFTATASDSYFIIVSSQNTLLGPTTFDPGLASTSDYTLQLSLDTLQPGEFFGNDITIIDETEIEATQVIGDILSDFDSAFELARDSFKTAPNQLVENSTSVSTVTILGELRALDGSDIVKVFLNGGETLSLDFDLTNLGGSGFVDALPIQATFFDATGTSISVNTTFTTDAGSPTSEIFYTFTAPTAGEYYIELEAAAGDDQTGDYIAHFSIDVINLGGTGTTILNEREFGSPEFRPVIEDFNFSIDADFGINAFINDIGDVLLFGETTPANYELILQSFAFEGLLSDPNDRNRVSFSAFDNNGDEFNITSRDVNSVSTEVQIADIINGNGDDGALLSGVFNTGSIQGNLIQSGDFNGDGFDDLLVSDRVNSYTSTLVYGASNLPSDLSFATQAAINVATTGPMGPRTNTNVYSIGFAGDFNGDGFDDFIVNFSFTENYGSMLPRGGTAIVFGAAGPSGGINLAPATTVLTDMIVFEVNYGVTPLGDIDGDGFDDIGVLTYTGSPYIHEIIFGQDPANFTSDVNAYGRVDPFSLGAAVDKIAVSRTVNFPLSTSIGQTYSGTYNIVTVVPVGDTNGDGFDDLLLGFDNYNESFSYLLFGGTQADIEVLANQNFNGTLDSQELFSDTGIFLLANQNNPFNNSENIEFINSYGPGDGSPLQPLGDINGDGFTDLLFNLVPSSTMYGKYLANVGSVVVFGGPGLDDFAGDLGQPGLTLADVIDDGGAHGFRITSSELQDSVLPKNLILTTVENVGDINGDGFDDLLISSKVARGYGDDQQTLKEIVADPVILYGGPSLNNTGGIVDVSQLGSDEGFSLRDGFQAYGGAKDSLDSIGDINGDGFNDFSLRGSDLAGGIPGYASIYSQLNQGTLVVLGGGGIGTPDNAFTGSSSDDQFSAFPGSQIVRMGAGDDLIIYDPADTLVDGGSGSDEVTSDRQYLDLMGALLEIDITDPTHNLSRIETIDLGGFGNSLLLDASAILELSDSNTLTVTGSGTDSVTTLDTGWVPIDPMDPRFDPAFDNYEKGNSILLIDPLITNETVNVTIGGTDQSLTTRVSTNTSINITLADASSALTEVNGGGFTLNIPVTLDSGATLTVTAVSLGNATVVYDPGSAFKFLESGEVALDQFTFTSDNGSGFEVNTYRLNVEDPILDPINIVFGTPQAYTGGLFVPLFDPAISVTDVDSPFATSVSVNLDNTSTATTAGYLSIDPDLDPNFNFVVTSGLTFQDLVQLNDYNGQNVTTSQIEEFLQAIRYIPSDLDPAAATFFVSIAQADTTETFTTTVNTSLTPDATTIAPGNWNTPGIWASGAVPLATDEVVFTGDVGDTIDIVVPTTVGALYLNNEATQLNVKSDFTIAGELFITTPLSSAITIDAGAGPVSLTADTITLEKNNILTTPASAVLSLTGSNAITITANTMLEANGSIFADIGTTVTVETPLADLSDAFIALGAMPTDTMTTTITFSNPGDRIAINLGTFTTFIGADIHSIIFDNADINLTSHFILAAPDPTIGFDAAGLNLTGSATIGGAFIFGTARSDFVLDNDTVLSDATFLNFGTTTVKNNSDFFGATANGGLLDFAGGSTTIDNVFENAEPGAIALRTDTMLPTSITITANNELTNLGVIGVENVGQTITGSVNNRGVIAIDPGASLTIENAASLLTLAGGEVFLADNTAVLIVNDGHVVIDNDTFFTNGVNGTNVILSATTDVVNGAAALFVDTAMDEEGLILRGGFTLGPNSLDVLVNLGTLDQALSLFTLDFGGRVEFIDESSWNVDLDTAANRDHLIFEEVQLDGQIRPRFPLGNTFTAGDSFVILSALSMMGSFSYLESLVDATSELPFFQTPGVIDNTAGSGLVGNVVYDFTPGASTVTFEVVGVTQDSLSNSSNPIFVATAGLDVILGSGTGNDYQGIGAGDIVVDQNGSFETFRVTALDFSRIAAVESGTNRLSLEAPGTFDFTTLPGTALENINQLVFQDGTVQTVILDDIAISNLMDEQLFNGPLQIISNNNEGDKVQLFGDFFQGNVSTSVEYFSKHASLVVSDTILVEVFRSDATTAFYGTSMADTLIGTGGDDFIDAGAGNDTVDAQGGNDEIIFDLMDTGLIDGGSEVDTLNLDGGMLDLSTVNNLVNFEKIDASGAQLTILFTDLFTDLLTTDNFLEPGAIDVFSTDPSFGDHQLLLDGSSASSLVIQGIDLLLDPDPVSSLLTAGVTVGAALEIEGNDVLPLTMGDVTIFLTDDLLITPPPVIS
ncbi:MAG: VCBS repeat-containing protein [Candidatus Azotimanducaceae bacterium]